MASKRIQGHWRLLPVFIICCYGVAYFGSLFTPGEWYQSLNRAPWNPPNIAFPIVWTILYFFIALAGWIVFISGNNQVKILWLAQLFINAMWSWLFFAQHWIAISLVDIVTLVILVAILCFSCWRQKLTTATFLLLPYLLWLCLATSLNAYILINN